MYQKIVSKGHLDYCYLSIRLEFERDHSGIEIDTNQFKHILVEASTSLFGEVGGTSTIDVLRYNPIHRSAVIRVPQKFLVKFWAALTLYSSYDGNTCVFRVLQVSSHLMALAANSRGMPIVLADN